MSWDHLRLILVCPSFKNLFGIRLSKFKAPFLYDQRYLLSRLRFLLCFFCQMMVALYDYNPEVQSPQDNPDSELPFKKGQILTVIGDMVSQLPRSIEMSTLLRFTHRNYCKHNPSLV